jgi:hypothetical protein
MKAVIISLLCLVVLEFSACGLDELMKTIEPPQVSNIFTTAESFMVNPGDTALFWVDATDPQDETLNYKWTLSAGIIIGSAQRDTLHWKAPLSGNIYPIKVEVSNSEESVTRSENIIVITSDLPYVKIVEPAKDEYLVQYQPVIISTKAFSNYGINTVYLWINDNLMLSQPGDVSVQFYKFDWDGVAPAGVIEIKVTAVSQITAMTGSDSIRVPLEGIVRGKKR